MVDECTEFIFIETIFINTVQRYFLPAKYKILTFFLFQEKQCVEFFFRSIKFLELFEFLNRSDL